ncbi:uncharacterized protein [Oscarella lobularis]|uniref:uncharacterized protein n=1 Tax=Oscarella lobularis TaxID=121494 RepID=UPI0033137D65
MTFVSLILAIGSLLLTIPGVQPYDCYCKSTVGEKEIRVSNEPIEITRGDVIDVTCHRPRLDGDGLRWESEVTSCRQNNNNETCWTYVSKLTRILTIKSATIDETKRQFACRLEDIMFPTTCCTVNIVIQTNTNNEETTMMTTATTNNSPTSSTSTNVANSTSTLPYSNFTLFQNVSTSGCECEGFCWVSVTISATVCAIGALLIALIVVFKRKRDYTSKTCSKMALSNE